MIRRLAATMTALAILSASAAAPTRAERIPEHQRGWGVTWTIEPDTLSIVVGEPVTFVGRLVNHTGRVIRVRKRSVGKWAFQWRMTDPEGVTWVGEEWDGLEVCLIDWAHSLLVDGEAWYTVRRPNALSAVPVGKRFLETIRTFSRPGRYKLQLGLVEARRGLWRPPDGSRVAWSNVAVVDVREPSAAEAEVIGTWWALEDWHPLEISWRPQGIRSAMKRMDELIERHRTLDVTRHIMVQYIRRTHCNYPDADCDTSRAMELISELERRCLPHERYYVELLRARLLVREKRYDEAVRVLEAAVRRWPWASASYVEIDHVYAQALARGDDEVVERIVGRLSRERTEPRFDIMRAAREALTTAREESP